MCTLCHLFQPKLQVRTLKDRLEEELLSLFAPVWDVAAGDTSLHLALFVVACFCSQPIEVCSQAQFVAALKALTLPTSNTSPLGSNS